MKFVYILLICSKIIEIIYAGENDADPSKSNKEKKKLDEYLIENPSISNEFSQKSIKIPKFNLNESPNDRIDSFNDKSFDLNKEPDDGIFSISDENVQHSSSYNIQPNIAESSSNPTIDNHINQSHTESTIPNQYHVDYHGKFWDFCAHVGKNINREKLLTEFGFSRIIENQKTLNLHCRRRNPAGGRCPFSGIYLKSNGYLYTRGKHEHLEYGNTPQNVGDDYIDYHGKMWSFNEEIGKDAPNEKLHNEFGLSIISNNERTLNLKCQKVGTNGGICPFKGIYLKSNGCLYTQGQHEHKFTNN